MHIYNGTLYICLHGYTGLLVAVLQVRQLALAVLVVGGMAFTVRLRIGVQVVQGVERVGDGVQPQCRQDGDTGQGLQVFVKPGRDIAFITFKEM